MIGTSDEPGIIPRALNELFTLVQQEKSKGKIIGITLTFIEVYNEQLKDLLDEKQKKIDIVEDPLKGLYLNNAKEMELTTVDDVFRFIVFFHNKRR